MGKWDVRTNEGEKVMEALQAMAPMVYVKEAEKTVPTVPPKPADPAKMPTIDITNYDSPNQSQRGATINALVLHNAAGKFIPSIEWLCNPEAQASAHLVIGRSGNTACLVDFSKKAWHAGNAEWNSCSIGIEIEAYEGAEGMTAEQEAKVVEWCRWFIQRYNIPKSRIKAHRQVCETDCPGFIWPTDESFRIWVAKL